jgi:HAD superfamily hydrolase (TIGR01509 family)
LSPTALSRLLQQRDSFLFDLDGTLVDSNACHERAYQIALRPRLPELASNFNYEPCKGRRTIDALRDLGIEDEQLIQELNETKQQAYRELVGAGAVVLIPYARDVLEALRRRGSRLFIVTGGSRRSSESVLRSLGILDWFEALVTADDIVNSKPAPDCWLQCVASAGLEPGRSLVVEDAVNCILSARAAGLDAIAVNNPELAHLPEYAGSLEDVINCLSKA